MTKELHEVTEIFNTKNSKNKSYISKYATDFVSTFFIVIIFVLLILYYFYKSQINRLKYGIDSKGNSIWSKEKCKMHILPISGNLIQEPGLSSYDTTYKNFKECSKEGHRMGFFKQLNPFYVLSGGISGVFTAILTATRGFGGIISTIADYLLNLFKANKNELDIIKYEINRTLNLQIFKRLNNSLVSVKKTFLYLYGGSEDSDSNKNNKNYLEQVIEYLLRVFYLVAGYSAESALLGKAITYNIWLLPYTIYIVTNELLPLKADLAKERQLIQEAYKGLLTQTPIKSNNGEYRDGISFPIIPPFLGPDNIIDQQYSLFHGAGIREMSIQEKQEEEKKLEDDEYYKKTRDSGIRIKFHRDRGNINSLIGMKRPNLKTLKEKRNDIESALIQYTKIFYYVYGKMVDDTLNKNNEETLRDTGIGSKRSDRTKNPAKGMTNYIRYVAGMIYGGEKATILEVDPKHGNVIGYGGKNADDDEWAENFYNKCAKQNCIIIEIGGSWSEKQIGGDNDPDYTLEELEDQLENEKGKSKKWKKGDWVTGWNNYRRIYQKWKEMDNFNVIIDKQKTNLEEKEASFKNSLLIPLSGDPDTSDEKLKAKPPYEIMLIGLDDPKAEDEERKPFWLVTDENDARPGKAPENPYGDAIIGSGNKFDEEEGGLGLAINSEKGWSSSIEHGVFSRPKAQASSSFHLWDSGMYGEEARNFLRIHTMNKNSAKIMSTVGPKSYAGGTIQVTFDKWAWYFHLLPKLDDYKNDGNLHNFKEKIYADRISDAHIEYLRKKTSTLTPQIVDEIRKAGGLGFKDKNVYTKAGAWGKTAFIGSHLETLPLYKNNWDLNGGGHLKSYDPNNQKESGYRGWLPPKDDMPEAYTDLGIANPNFGCYGMGRNNFLLWEAVNGETIKVKDNTFNDDGFVADGDDNPFHGKNVKYKKITNGPQAGLWIPSGPRTNEGTKEEGNRAEYTKWLHRYFKNFDYDSVITLGEALKYASSPSDADWRTRNDDFGIIYDELPIPVNFVPRNSHRDLGASIEHADTGKVEEKFAEFVGRGEGGAGTHIGTKSAGADKTEMFLWPLLMTLENYDGSYDVKFRNPTVYTNISVTCFGKNTIIPLQNNKTIFIQNIKLGDILEDGSVVTSTSKSIICENRDNLVYLYKINGIIITGKHRIEMADGKIIPAYKYPGVEKIYENEYKHKYVYCFNTDSKRIKLNGINFCDWDEVSKDEIDYFNSFNNNQIIGIDKPLEVIKGNTKCSIIHNELESGFHPNTEINIIGKGLIPIKNVKLGDKIFNKTSRIDNTILSIIKVRIDDIKLYKHTIYGRTIYGTNNLIYSTECKYYEDNMTTASTYFQHDREFKEEWQPKHKQKCYYHLITSTEHFFIDDIQFCHYNYNLEKFLPENLYLE